MFKELFTEGYADYVVIANYGRGKQKIVQNKKFTKREANKISKKSQELDDRISRAGGGIKYHVVHVDLAHEYLSEPHILDDLTHI